MAVPFLRQGLDGGERVVAILGPSTRALLDGALGGDGDDILAFANREWYRRPLWTLAAFDKYLRSQLETGAGVRILAEPLWETAVDAGEWQRCEAVLNLLVGATDSLVLCVHDTRAMSRERLDGAMQTHAQVAIPGGRIFNPMYLDPAEFCARSTRSPLAAAPAGAASIKFRQRLIRVRQFVAREGLRLGLGRERSEVLMLAAGEVAGNCLDHGGGRGTVRVWAAGDEVVCEVEDGGPGFADPLAGYVPPDPELMRRCGLWLVRQLCDLVEVRASESGSLVRIHLALAAPA